MRTLALIALGILAGCSSAPPASETMTASAADAAAPASTGAEAPESTGDKHEFKPPPGYKAKIDGWNIVYCRKMPVLGSRFPKQVCMTETELKEHMAANDTMKRDKDQVSRVCSQAAGCANP
jgi:hypothetical protein